MKFQIKHFVLFCILLSINLTNTIAQIETQKEFPKNFDCKEILYLYKNLPDNLYLYFSKMEVGSPKKNLLIDSLAHKYLVEYDYFSSDCINIDEILIKVSKAGNYKFQSSEVYALFNFSLSFFLKRNQSEFVIKLNSLKDKEIYDFLYFLFANAYCRPVYEPTSSQLIKPESNIKKYYHFLNDKNNLRIYKIFSKVLINLKKEIKYFD
jgi:hypothetical protein